MAGGQDRELLEQRERTTAQQLKDKEANGLDISICIVFAVC